MKKIVQSALLLAAAWTIIPTAAARTCSTRVKKRGPDRKQIALTFDDGPDPVYTPLLLDVLHQYNVKATFFVVGEKAERHPDLIRRIQLEGHEIGIHNDQHISNWFLFPSAMNQQLVLAANRVSAITGQDVILYRPPWGHFNPFTLSKAAQFEIVMWTAIPGDWKKKMTAVTLAERLRAARSNGAVITLHDSGDTFGAYKTAPRVMIESLHLFLSDEVSAQYEFVTVSTLYTKQRA
ncbi:polysaccharide deacetylase family protein [Domibacillus antri]|nr:polysaccharide deacetylase family protein [Domibacillus antri]